MGCPAEFAGYATVHCKLVLQFREFFLQTCSSNYLQKTISIILQNPWIQFILKARQSNFACMHMSILRENAGVKNHCSVSMYMQTTLLNRIRKITGVQPAIKLSVVHP
jgi:hypothetical protein